jgi:hypothetical protein
MGQSYDPHRESVFCLTECRRGVRLLRASEWLEPWSLPSGFGVVAHGDIYGDIFKASSAV